AQAAARSPADGYHYYLGTTAALTTNPLLFKKLSYNPATDFEPVAFVSSSPFALFVQGNSSINSVPDLVSQAQQSKQAFAIGHEGPRTFGGMITRLLNQRAKAGANLVPYSG